MLCSRRHSLRIASSLLSACAAISLSLPAQALQWEYSTYLPERSFTNLDVDDDGFIYVGTLEEVAGGAPVFMVGAWKIDPTQVGADSLVWSYTFGGMGQSVVEAIAVDESGRLALVGSTESSSFPVVNGYDIASSPSNFVTVLNAAGDDIIYSTRLGGEGSYPYAVAFQGGKVYVTGMTAEDSFPQRNGLVTGVGTAGETHAFLSVFDPAQSGDASLLYSTTLGDDAGALWMDLDAAGDVYLMGIGVSARDPAVLPITPGAFQTTPDTFWVARVDTSQSGDAALIYATFVGGSGTEVRSQGTGGIAVDGAGNAYMVGGTSSDDWPTSVDALQGARVGAADAFITKLNPSGTDIVWSTYLGGPAADDARGVALHPDGSVSVIGQSNSGADFPQSACALAENPNTTYGAFLSRISADGTTLLFSDFLEDVEQCTADYVRVIDNTSTAVLARGSVPLVNGFEAQGTMPDYIGVTRTVDVCADLSLSLPGVDTFLSVLVGEVVHITAQIDNAGPNPVSGGQLTFLGHAGLRVLGGYGPGGDCVVTGDDALCDVGDLPVGGQAMLELQVSPGIASGFYYLVIASSAEIELDPSDNQVGGEIISSNHSGPCATLTYQGECVGNTLRYCQDRGTSGETLHEVDCATVFPDTTGLCVQVDPVYGHDCVVPDGESCFYTDAFGNPVFALCEGSTAGCLLDDTTGEASCQDVGVSCFDPPGDVFQPLCAGDVVVVDCQARQPVAFDCTAFGGSCQDAACVSLPEGSSCDENLLCGAGLVCHAPTGTCVPPADVCDADTYTNSCAGDVYNFCDVNAGVARELDCATLFSDGPGACGIPFTCLDGGDGSCAQLQVACHGAGEGAPCDLAMGIFCGPGFGCVIEDDGAGGRVNRCRAIGTCAHGDDHVGCVGEIATTCYSNSLISAAEAHGVDCDAYNSRCQLDDETGYPRCVARLDGECALDDPDGLFACPPGLECVYDSVRSGAFCQIAADGGYYDAGADDATPAPDVSVMPDSAQADAARPDTSTDLDAGVQPDSAVEQDGAVPGTDAGGGDDGDDDDDEGGCGCGDCSAAGVSGARADAYLIVPALALLLLARRRRN